jgi:hypothetical protein
MYESAPAASAPPAPGDASVAAEFCAEVGRRVSQADCDVLTQLADQAEAGVAAFNAPDPLRRGEAHMLQLAISFAPPEEDAREPASSDPEKPALEPADVVADLPGSTVEFAPLVGRFMRAELVGAGFEITPLTPASQEVLTDSVTTWSWRAVANEGGQRTLTLTTVVEGCTSEGQCYPLRSTSRNYSVKVTVGWLGRAQDMIAGVPTWIRLLSAVVAALAGLTFAFFSLRNALRGGRDS